MSAKKKTSARAARREAERAALKLARDRERLAALEPGGAPERPIDLTSASEVEVSARSMPCPRCGGEVRVDEHLAETVGASRLRIAKVSCPGCGHRRAIYFRLGGLLPN
jgi:DNA-directed RNA polymerase subunit M/transcription elongation factor TFIIS